MFLADISSYVVFWTAIAVMAVGPVIATCWVKIAKAKYEAQLKRSMIESGMSADEIERVLAAGSDSSEKKRADSGRSESR